METVLPTTRGIRGWLSKGMLFRAGLAGLLLAEVLALTLRFDAQDLVDRGGWWGPWIASARYLPQGLMALTAAAVVFGGRLRPERPTQSGPNRPGDALPRPAAWWFLAAHLTAFGLLAALTAAVWEGPPGRSTLAPVWAMAWLATGVVSVLLLTAAAWPPDGWGRAISAALGSGVLPAVVLVGAGACLAGRATGALWEPLGHATLWSVRAVLGLVFADVTYHAADASVGAHGFVVEVAPSCSGYEGVGLIWAFLGVYLWFFRRELRFPQALWLVPVGTAVMWCANVARIVALIALGATLSPEIALGGFHSQAGWLAFNAVALGLVLLSRRARLFAAPEAEAIAAFEDSATVLEGPNPTAAYLGPLLGLVAVVMVTTALSPPSGFDAFYPARVLVTAGLLWAFREGHDELWGKANRGAWWSWTAVAIGLAVFALWMALEPAAAPGAGSVVAEGLGRLPRWLAACWLAFRVAGSVVTVPLAEELAFRGYLTRRLIRSDFSEVEPGRLSMPSLLISSLIFGVLHGRWLAGTIAGVLYALAYHRRGRLSDAVLAHALTNALIAAYVLATGSWSLWL